MRIIPPSHEIISMTEGGMMLKNLELCGRVCYKSEDRITEDSAEKFISMILKSGHESVLEHEKITVKFICDRGVSHEIVRHRIASYSQESTRYCNYSKDKFGGEITFIRPFFRENDEEKYAVWQDTMQRIEEAYFRLISLGAKPEEARSILPNSVKTELVATMNIREWRHFFRLRTSPKAHPQMRESACALLCDLKERVPLLFDDISPADSTY